MKEITIDQDLRERPLPGRFGHGWIGLALVLIFWPMNWFLPGMRTHILFFPLWLGYILTIDGLILRRQGKSLLTTSRVGFILLFIVSAPAWWLFEVLNWRTRNWEYLGRNTMGNLEYFFWASLCFSTVIPAVYTTAQLLLTYGPIDRFRQGKAIRISQPLLIGLMGAGWAMLALLLLVPQIFYPFMWLSILFLLEPICVWLKRHSILEDLQQGDWRRFVVLPLGALICGFFWELWNYYAFPKWIYHVPIVGFWHIFEMPLLGYLGYLPFGLELLALGHLFNLKLRPRPIK